MSVPAAMDFGVTGGEVLKFLAYCKKSYFSAGLMLSSGIK